MRAVTTDEKTLVYGQMDEQAISIASLEKGEEFELGKVIKKKKVVWVEAKLDSGVTGYINGNAKIFSIKKVEILLDGVPLYASPASNSSVLKSIKKGDIFQTLRVEKNDEAHWVRVRDLNGLEGYIAGNTRIRIIPPNSRSSARKTILFGLVLAAVGAIITGVSPANQENPTYYYLAMGFLLFGVLQILQGGLQYYQAVKQEKREAQSKALQGTVVEEKDHNEKE